MSPSEIVRSRFERPWLEHEQARNATPTHASAQAMPRVEVIVLNWNGRADTLECLDSLQRLEYPNYGVTVVDNGSHDDSVSAIGRLHPGITLIRNETNLGFAAGNNRGIEHALANEADFVLLLNNDTVVARDLLSTFVAATRQFPDGGIFGAKIYYYAQPNTIWYAGGYWDAQKLSFGESGAGVVDEGQFDAVEETEWVIGCAMLVRRNVVHDIGALEPEYFLNNEEIDFCSRARRAGYKCVFVPHARVWHKVSISFGGEHSPLKEYFSSRNRLLWASRNANLGLRLAIHRDNVRILARRFLRPPMNAMRSKPLAPKSWW